jgi:hypothetical protein
MLDVTYWLGWVKRAAASHRHVSWLACGAGVLGAFLFCGTPVARADSVTMTLQNDMSMLRSGCVTLWAAGSTPGTDAPSMSKNVYIGEYQWQQAGTPTGGLASHFGTFCIELPQGFPGGPTFTYDTGTPLGQSPVATPETIDLGFGPMGPGRAAMINELFAQDYAQVTSAAAAAQFQIAVWDAIYNYGYATPYLKVTGISTTTADAWYTDAANALTANGGVAPDAHLVVLTNPEAQDQVTVSTAPLPGPLTIGLALLAGLAVVRVTANVAVRYDAAHEKP